MLRGGCRPGALSVGSLPTIVYVRHELFLRHDRQLLVEDGPEAAALLFGVAPPLELKYVPLLVMFVAGCQQHVVSVLEYFELAQRALDWPH